MKDNKQKISYWLEGIETDKENFEKFKGELDVEKRGVEGALPEGFITAYKAVNKETERKYEYSIMNNGEKAEHSIVQRNPSPIPEELAKRVKTGDITDRQAALYELIDTCSDNAASILIELAEKDSDLNIYELAIYGFIKIHPDYIARDMERIALSRKVAEAEFPHILQSNLVVAISLSQNRNSLEILKNIEKKLPASWKGTPFWESLEFALLTAYANLKDKDSIEKLIKKLEKFERERDYDSLGHILSSLKKCKNIEVARRLLKFLDCKEFAFRVLFVDSGPEFLRETKTENAEKVRVSDCAFSAISAIMENVFGIKPEKSGDDSVIWGYSDKQIKNLKKRLKNL